jgi:hypothetical protein
MTAITAFGVVALTLMMVMYALERRGRAFTLTFAFGCLLSSVWGSKKTSRGHRHAPVLAQ